MSKQYGLDNVKEAILKGTAVGENSYKADRLIEEFTRKAIDEPNPSEALEWIRAQARELCKERNAKDLDEAISTNYFTIGFLVGWLMNARSDLMESA